MTDFDRRPALYRSYEHAASIVAGITSDQLAWPTPCTRYDVATLVDHIVGAGRRAVALGRGEAPTGDEFPHIELEEAPDELRRAAKEAEAAWSNDAQLTNVTRMPWGEEYRGATLVDMYLSELAGHAWDLARATGQAERLDADLALSALEAARTMLKPEYRDMVEPGSPFGPEIPAPDEADAWERFAAFLGRSPR